MLNGRKVELVSADDRNNNQMHSLIASSQGNNRFIVYRREDSISTLAAFSITGVSGVGQDLLVFTPTSLGPTTAGTWAVYFDGSDVGFASSSKGIDAVAIDAGGRIHVSTSGSFAVTGVSGADEDVFVFVPSQLGATTTGLFSSSLFFDGSVRGVTGDVVAIDLS